MIRNGGSSDIQRHAISVKRGKWVIEWLSFNAKWTIFQLYHGENKLLFDEMTILDQHAELDFYSASSLKQQSAGRYVAPLRHTILILIPIL